jgi:GrpB-like predicted nucleotidyltransferase (UPF0157 family)
VPRRKCQLQYPTLIREYDLTWPDRFAALAARVQTALGEAMLRAEHVGSIAVPGLAARPIIDLDVVVSRADLPEAMRRLANLGFTASHYPAKIAPFALIQSPGGLACPFLCTTYPFRSSL